MGAATVDHTVRVVAVGNYACANVGDELLLDAVRQWVWSSGGQITVISLNPEHTRRTHGLVAVDYYDLPAIATVMRSADILVLGGGGIFTDRFMYTLPQLYDYPSFTLAQFACICYMARQFGLKLVLWGQGVGPIGSRDAGEIVSDLFQRAEYVSVRDTGSLTLLRRLGVTRPLTVAPDPVWGLDCDGQTVDIAERFPELAGKRVLLLNPLVFEQGDLLAATLASALSSVLTEEWACLWVPFQKMSFDGDAYGFSLPDDRPLIDKIIASVAAPCRHVVWDPPALRELLPVLRQVDAAVVSRFHGTILALRARAPLVVIEYDVKVTHAADAVCVPASQRLRPDSVLEAYVTVLHGLLRTRRGDHWRPEEAVLARLGAESQAHGQMLRAAIADPTITPPHRPAWQSNSFPWFHAWCVRMNARRWEAERRLRVLNEALQAEQHRNTVLTAELRALQPNADLVSSGMSEPATPAAAYSADARLGDRLWAWLRGLGGR
jgi:polysaccharide pyruvyl transferase CsaB